MQLSEFIFYTDVYFSGLFPTKLPHRVHFPLFVSEQRLSRGFSWKRKWQIQHLYCCRHRILFNHQPLCRLISCTFTYVPGQWNEVDLHLLGDYLAVAVIGKGVWWTFLGDGDECICVFSMIRLYQSSACYRLYSRWSSPTGWFKTTKKRGTSTLRNAIYFGRGCFLFISDP